MQLPSPQNLPAILALQHFPSNVESALEARYHVCWQEAEDALDATTAGSIRAIATGGVRGASRLLLEKLPAVELIAICGVGTDAVDLAYARKRGIRISNTPDVLTDDVADLAMGLLLAAARRICVFDRTVRAGNWAGTAGLAMKVAGKRLGIVGFGRIGRAVAARAAGFGMTVSYHSRSRQPGAPQVYRPSLVELAGNCDFLVICASGGAASVGLIGRDIIEALGPKGILINVARGSVVDEPALVEALKTGRLGGAGLDVFTAEPAVPAALFELENVVLSPHRGSATIETRTAMGDLMLANLAAHFAGRPLPSPVT